MTCAYKWRSEESFSQLACSRCHSGFVGSVLVAWRSLLDSKEGVAIPIRTRDLPGDRRKGLENLSIPLKAVIRRGHRMSLVPPLADQLCSGSNPGGDTSDAG